MTQILEDFSDPALIAAIENNLFAFWEYLDGLSGMRVRSESNLLWTMSNIPFPLFNSVFRAQLDPERLGEEVDEILARYEARRLPTLWWVGPRTSPSGLGSYLEGRGLTHVDAPPGMAVDLQKMNEDLSLPKEFRSERVSDERTTDGFATACVTGFGLPEASLPAFRELGAAGNTASDGPFLNYVGFLDNEAVASSSMQLGEGVAGIYNVATIPEARGYGIGAAMTLEPLRFARESGYRVGILHASQMGFSVYKRLGFQEYCRIDQYLNTVRRSR